MLGMGMLMSSIGKQLGLEGGRGEKGRGDLSKDVPYRTGKKKYRLVFENTVLFSV
jgi:hypothetical protein